MTQTLKLSEKQKQVLDDIKFMCENREDNTAVVVLDYRQKSGVKLSTLVSLKDMGLIQMELIKQPFQYKSYSIKLVKN